MPNLLEFWYAALRSPSGVRIRILQGENRLALAKLYKARTEALDERLASLSICVSPTASDEIWIVHREASAAEPEQLALEI